MQSGGNYAFGFDTQTESAFTEQVTVERNEEKIECLTPFSVDSEPKCASRMEGKHRLQYIEAVENWSKKALKHCLYFSIMLL